MEICWTFLRSAERIALLAGAALWARPVAAANIACVGDSITFGYGLGNGPIEAYPAVLQTLVGSAHTVQNFGSSGCTLLKKGDKPYWTDPEYAASDAFKPDVVVIMLGTNDAKPYNWTYQTDFTGDYNTMIAHYRSLGALVYVAAPPPVFPPGAFNIDPDTLNNQVVPLVRQIAAAANAPLVDVYQALYGQSTLFMDYVHPTAAGDKIIAQTVYAAIQQGGYGGYAGSTSAGGAQGTGGTKSTGGVSSTGGGSAAGGRSAAGGAAPASGGTKSAAGGTKSTGGSVSKGGASGTSVSSVSGGTSKNTGGSAGTGGASSTIATAQGGQSGGASALPTTNTSGLGGSSSSGGSQGSTEVTGGTNPVTGTDQAGAATVSGGSDALDTAVGETTAASVAQHEKAGGCGCRIQGRGASAYGAWIIGLLALARARRRRQR